MTPPSTSSPDAYTPSVRSLVALLVLVTLGVAAFVVLFLATPAAERPDVWAAIRVALPATVVLIPTLLGYIGIRAVKAETAAQSATLSTIHRNTNGVLDERIRNGVRAVLREAAVPADAPDIERSRLNAASDEQRTSDTDRAED